MSQHDHGKYDTIALTIEILGCRGLIPLPDSKKTNPYVKALFGKRRIHSTDKIVDSLNPTFSRDEKSSFILMAAKGELQALGLILKIKDWRDFFPSKELGQTYVSAKELLAAEEGDRLEFQIHKPRRIDQPAGVIAISCRPAKDKELFYYETKSLTIPRDNFAVMNHDNMLALRIQILACRGLMNDDDQQANKTDAYVKALFGTRRIHSTDRIPDSLNPIFLQENNSSFLLVVEKEELEEKGLTLKIKDWRHLLPSKELGQAHVPAKELLAAEEGDRLEFRIHKPRRIHQPAGVIAISCRKALDKEIADYYGTMPSDMTQETTSRDLSSSLSDEQDAANSLERTSEMALVDTTSHTGECTGEWFVKRTELDLSDHLDMDEPEDIILDPCISTRLTIPQYDDENQDIHLLLQKLNIPATASPRKKEPALPLKGTIQIPHCKISQVSSNVYLVSEENVSTGKMIVVRKKDSSDLILINSLRLSEKGLEDLDRLGNVKHIIRQATHEGLDDSFYQERYGATLSIE